MSNCPPPKKVLVCGCFDQLNSDDVKFLEEGAAMGNLYVCIENDKAAVFNETERLYMVQSIKYVYNARLMSNFESVIDDINPAIFYTKKHDEEKKSIVNKMNSNIEYIVSNNEMDEKQQQQNVEKEDKDKQIEKLKYENTKLRELATALNTLNDSTKVTSNLMRKQIIKLQKDLVNSFSCIVQLKQKLDEKDKEPEEEEDDDEDICSLCFGMIESDNLIIIKNCEHQFHPMCIYQSIQADVGIYEKMPICSVCDADGKQIAIPNEVVIDVIQRQDQDFLAQYQALVDSTAKTND